MSKKMKNVPKLRFPEFVNDGEWEKVKLGELVTINSGISPSSYELKTLGKYPFLKVEDLNNCVKYQILSREYSNSGKNIIQKKSIIFPKRGAAILLNKVRITNFEVLMDTNLMAITPNEKIDSEFLYYIIDKVELSKIADSSTIPQINNKHIIPFEISSPKLNEQKKIADCLSSLDALLLAQSQKIELLKEHKKALLQNLFPTEGTNTPKLRFPEFKNAPKWEEAELRSLISYFKGFAFQSKDYTSTGRRIVRVSDMGFDYIKNETNAIYINTEKAKQFEKWELKKDDLIITTVGSKPPVYDSLVGRTIVVESKDETALLNQNAVCLRANKKVEQSFFNTLFKRSEYVSFIESIIRGNANQGSIALDDLFKYRCFLPSPLEQQKIADFLSSIDELITSSTKKAETLKEHKKALMQQLFPSKEEN